MNPFAKSTAFVHQQYAHCESGVTTGLLRQVDAQLSEPMTFGIGNGIFFGHFPIIKVMNLPLTTFRSAPGAIAKKAFKRMGVSLGKERFSSEQAGQARLDSLLDQGFNVGAQVSVMWLPYLPKRFRFPFNAHHVVVVGMQGDEYLISDPVGEEVATCKKSDFNRARFANGPLAPKGLIYYPTSHAQHQSPTQEIIATAIKETAARMVYAPVPWFGTRGIQLLSRHMRNKWPKKFREEPAKLNLNIAQVVRMAEEIGTGGAGFRFLYSAFLQEVGEKFSHDAFGRASEAMMRCGDEWRGFSADAVKFCKGSSDMTIGGVADRLEICASMERDTFKELHRAARTWSSRAT
jgi:Domain of unknown function (DUF4872)/Butirosin biosynthesis protein H, N-terminal